MYVYMYMYIYMYYLYGALIIALMGERGETEERVDLGKLT